MPNNALLISIRPRFAEMIFTGTKTVELRRVRPRIGKDDMVFVYVSSPVMALEGAFEVDEIVSGSPNSIWRRFGSVTGLSKQEFDAYFEGKKTGFAIKIRRYWRLASPVSLANLKTQRIGFHPPQGYQYISERDFCGQTGLESLARAGNG
jgi:predicted transcriptional regulator